MKYPFLFLLIAVGVTVHAQNLRVRGSVKDSLGNPLELANIIATVKSDGSMANFAIANQKGEYSISLPKGGDYTLTASFLGMRPLAKELSLPSNAEDQRLDFVLQPETNRLDEVELVHKMPVVVRGDTIVYDTDAFTNGNERKLGDVLKKLPGVELTDEGEIKVEGQTVSKVMVEGKDFFDGDSKLAAQNIPADALEKVEILRNYNEVGQMRGLGNDRDNYAINIKLKEGKKNFWFGEIEGAIGDGDKTRYLGSTKLFYYDPKGSVNLIGNLNNIGEVPFTFRDYFNFTGGMGNFNAQGGTSINMGESDLGFLMAQNQKANEMESKFGAANFSYTASDEWDISGFAIFNAHKTNFVENSLKTYIQTETEEENNSITDQENLLGMAKLSTVFRPSHRLQVDYDMVAKKSQQTQSSDALSIFYNAGGNVENSITENKENDPFSVNQNLNVYFTLDAKNIFAAYLQHRYQEEDPFYEAILSVRPFVDILPLYEEVEVFDLNQEKQVKTNKLDAKLDYYYILNERSNLNLRFGTTLSRQDFSSSIFQILEPGYPVGLWEEGFNNEVRYHFRDLYLGAYYKVRTGIFTFTPGISLHSYSVGTEQLGSRNNSEKTLLLPNIFAIAQFRQSESLRFHYNMTADYTDIHSLAEGYVLNGYNSLFRGNRELENAIFHSLGLNYVNFNMFNFTNMNANVNYSSRVSGIRNNTSITQIDQVSTPVNSNFPDETLSAFGRFQKTFRKLKANLQARISLENLNLVVNGEDRRSQNFTRSYEASVETNFKSAPNFGIGFNRMVNQYNNGDIKNTFYTDRPFANAEINFLNGFTFTANYSYYDYYNKDGSVANEYSFLEAGLFYRKPESKWEFRIDAHNLLDVDSLNRDSFNENFNTTTAYYVQPRILMLGIKYDL